MKIRHSLSLALSLLVLPCLYDFCAAQQASSGSSSTAAGAQQVLLPVMVVDKKGTLVTNLTAKDFTLTEDGRPQVITSLTNNSSTPFRLGLIVDTSRPVMSAMDAERKAAEKFVNQMLPAAPSAAGAAANSSSPSSSPASQPTALPGSEAFLIHFDREVELLEDFTSSPEKLDHEIDEMGPTSGQRSSPQGPETNDDDRGYGGSHADHGNGAQLYDAIYLASDQLMKSKTGRKALIVFSDGADHGSKETLNDAIDAADRANLEVCTIYYKGQEERENNGFPGGRRGGMGGGGYPGGGGGWPGSGGGGYPGGGGNGRRGPTSESGIDGRKIMQEIAQRTGGMFFDAKKKDDLDQIYGWIASGLRQQYLLAYTPDKPDSEDDFHKIVLKVNNADYTVQTPEGYYPPEKQ